MITAMKSHHQEIKRIATGFRKGMIGSKTSKKMCFAISCALAGYLNFSGYKCKVVEGKIGDWNHFWIALLNGQILDVTSDQFPRPDGTNMPTIYIGEKPKWYTVG